jgi:hypothetical protein
MSFRAVVAQLVERVLGKDEVTSSILVNGSTNYSVAVLKRRNAETPGKRVEFPSVPGLGVARIVRKAKWQRKNSIAPSRT